MRIQVVLGSTRPGRITERVAKWVVNEAKELADAQVELIDLQDYQLPYLDEPISPQYNPDRKPNPAAKKLLDTFAKADAIILVTPEYNRSYSAVIKNAIDYVDFQFKQKPVMLVSHGSTGGAQAISHLRGVIPGLLGVTTPKAVYVTGARNILDEQGNLNDEAKANPYGPEVALKDALSDLVWYGEALATARKQTAVAVS